MEPTTNPQTEETQQDASQFAPNARPQPDKQRFAGLYREDVVQSASQPGCLGLVSKVAGDSDSDSSDSEDEDMKDEMEKLPPGHARVCWANSEEMNHKIEDIKVVDRSFLHGDIVARVSSPMGQTGRVMNVELKLDLQNPGGEIVRGIDSKKIKRVRPYMVGDYVIHNHWLGRVDEILDNVTVMFEDGGRCKVSRAETDRLVPLDVTPMEDTECPYFPGQRVRASFSGLFKSARWIKGCWKSNRMEGIVVDVEVNSVIVHWMAAAHTGGNSQAPGVPAERQSPKNLRRLSSFSHTNWQLGDRAMVGPKVAKRKIVPAEASEVDVHSDGESKVVNGPAEGQGSETVDGREGDDGGSSIPVGSKDAGIDNSGTYRWKLKRRFTKHKKKASKKDDTYDPAWLIIGTKTKVDVLWQDGTREKEIDSCTLFPVDHLGDHDFWPEEHVMERGSDLEGSESTNNKRAGIVKSVDAKQRTAQVRWLAPTSHPQKWPCFDGEETVSVYELVEHPDYDYCLGDVVIRLCPTEEGPSTPFISTVDGAPSKSESQGDATVSSVEKNLESVVTTIDMDPDFVVSSVEMESNGFASKAQLESVASISEAESDCTNEGSVENHTKMEDTMETKENSETTDGLELDKSEEPVENEGEKKATDATEPEDFSWVGLITDVQDGQIEVAWADGTVSRVGSQAIFVVGRDEDDASSQGSAIEIDDVLDDAASWTTVDSREDMEAEQDLGQVNDPDNDASVIPNSHSSEDGDQSSCELPDQTAPVAQSAEGSVHVLGTALSLPFSVLIRALRFAANLLLAFRGSKNNLESGQNCTKSLSQDAKGDGHLLGSNDNVQKEREDGILAGNKSETLSSTNADTIQNTDSNNALEDDGSVASEDDNDNVKTTSSPMDENDLSGAATDIVKRAGSFKQFDIVKDSSDHNYNKESCQPSNQRRWSKKIQQEWTMLEKSLPDTIFVRVYEDRMDLLRAVIIGAAGTPYHDGLFFFDLYLPSDYPVVPPLVHYNSGGLRLNPNLYETGKVCLSLLNTWTGKGNEIWHPSTSTILQVLVSIQGLVLNANPYFNEAGYDKQIGTAEGEKNSLAYAENSFLLSCKSMVYLIRRPPKHFEDFVKEHFRCRAPYILKACHAYMEGSPVGSLHDDCTVPPGSRDVEQSTTGFRLMLAKIIPKLTEVFKELGTDCDGELNTVKC